MQTVRQGTVVDLQAGNVTNRMQRFRRSNCSNHCRRRQQAAVFFIVHRDILVSRSGFFAKAPRGYTASDTTSAVSGTEGHHSGGKWREGDTGIVKLPKEKADIFAL